MIVRETGRTDGPDSYPEEKGGQITWNSLYFEKKA